jgi:hypothetical protein
MSGPIPSGRVYCERGMAGPLAAMCSTVAGTRAAPRRFSFRSQPRVSVRHPAVLRCIRMPPARDELAEGIPAYASIAPILGLRQANVKRICTILQGETLAM